MMFLNIDVMFMSCLLRIHGMSLIVAEFTKCQNIFIIYSQMNTTIALFILITV